MWVKGNGRDLVERERVEKRSSTQCHMPQNTSISVQHHHPPSRVRDPILPSSMGVRAGNGSVEGHVGPPGHPVAPILVVTT